MEVIIYIPFLFLLARKFCKEQTLQSLLLLILVQFLQFISGHPQETYYTMFFIALYICIFSSLKFTKRIAVIGAYLIFPVVLASVQLFPFIEYVQHANRSTGIQYAGWGGLTLPRLVTFLFPTFYGSHTDGTWWGPQQMLIGFIGIPTLLLLYIAVRFVRLRDIWYYVGGMVLSFFLAFGSFTPLFYLFYYVVPGWRLFRSPSGILVFYTFFASILVAYGVEYVKNNSEKFSSFGKVLAWIGGAGTVISAGVYVYAGKTGFWKNVLLFLQNHFHKHIFSTLLFYDTTKIQQMFEGILWNVVFASFFVCMMGIILAFFLKKTYQPFLLLFLTLLGFFIINPKVLFLAPLQFYDTGKNIPSVLQPVTHGQYRILSMPVDLHQNRQHLPPADFFYKEDQADLAIYQYDNNMERGLYQVAGYVSLVPSSFAGFIGAQDANTNVTNIDFSKVTQNQLSLASVRYVISYEPIKNYNHIPLHLVFKKKGQYIYENAQVLPRAYILENKNGQQVQWIRNSATQLSFFVNIDKPSHLILTDWYYPGWKALVNGKEVAIQRYLSTFREIAVPKGKSSVQFVYDPLSVKLGALLSFVSFGILGLLFILGRKKKL